MKGYRTVCADPPWPIAWSTPSTRVNGRGERHPNHTRTLAYPTMTLEEIAALPVRGMAARDAHLYLWTTDAYLMNGQAGRVAEAWGFAPMRCLVWSKASWGLGHGWRPAHEIALICRRGSLPFNDVSLGTVFNWKQPYVRTGNSVAKLHSAKPDGFLDAVEQASPGPYLELFARRARFGWAYWGDESLGTADLGSAA